MNFNNLRSTIYQCRTCLKIYNSEKELISLFDFDQTFPLQKIKFCTMLSHISIQKVSFYILTVSTVYIFYCLLIDYR